ncbi:class III lanthionine synthetase LanKC [Gryllotalpicola reticulitermitis]|uniref:non-specific serine/threonine protein kinase n=1 Tax=Gryllotalpicola reticulitermitis TaxID=1184153 RepID=A0ABV8QAD7_9MICO
MHSRYLDFVAADRRFYDVAPLGTATPTTRYRVPHSLDWRGWQRTDIRGWTQYHRRPMSVEQGWKIHVSATRDNAQSILNLVAAYAADSSLTFKFVPGEAEFRQRNDKQTDRGSAGKFITLYPLDEEELRAALAELERRVGGMAGPYILSDLRWNHGPLYVRYGAFRLIETHGSDGERLPAIRDPHGNAVPDARDAAFTPPSWLDLPDFLAAQRASLGDGAAPEGFPYQVTEALQFSNGGGIYRARSSAGRSVILKEARPFAGLTPDGRDAVGRTRNEEEILRRLGDDPTFVGIVDAFDADGHRFLVLEDIDGIPLSKALVQRSPMVRADRGVVDYLDYRAWALEIADQIERAVARLHAAGIRHGDLHPGNVLITPTSHVRLIDFEMAGPSSSGESAMVAAPGFAAPADLVGADVDLYSLACIKLFLFMPLTPILPLDSHKAEQLIEAAAEMYALPDEYVASIRAQLVPPRTPQEPVSSLARAADRAIAEWAARDEDGLTRLQFLIACSVNASADFSRADRCYPGDIRQFGENGYSLAHGAAGVLHALDAAQLESPAQASDWLHAAAAAPDADRHLGLFNGLAGVAWAQRRLGATAAASRTRERIMDRLTRGVSVDSAAFSSGLYSGLAGLGLWMLSEPDEDLLGWAAHIAAELTRRIAVGSPQLSGPGRPDRGLMWGPTGIALFALRLYERTGDRAHLALAENTLRMDLDRCAQADDGSLQMDEGWRLMPYLATGSAGLALVTAQLLPHVANPARYLRPLAGLERALHPRFTIEPGLFDGRAGIIHTLIALIRMGVAGSDSESALAAHVDALRLHAVRHATGVAFPGSGLIRLSMDLATGSTGVLTALQAYTLLLIDDEGDEWHNLLPLILPQTAIKPPMPTPAKEVRINDDRLPSEPADA